METEPILVTVISRVPKQYNLGEARIANIRQVTLAVQALILKAVQHFYYVCRRKSSAWRVLDTIRPHERRARGRKVADLNTPILF